MPPEADDYIFACERCEKVFKRKNALLSHMKMHTFIRKCGGGADLRQQQQQQQQQGGLADQNQRPVFKCDICYKCYNSKAGLKMHRIKAHAGKGGRVPCPQCERVFETKADVTIHLRTFKHNELRCNRCSTSFIKWQSFISHTHIHPQFIYKCAICLRTFTVEAELRRHAIEHREQDGAVCCHNAQRTDTQVEQFQRMMFEYCLSYVGLVKTTFASEPDRYLEFLETMKEFKLGKLTMESLRVRIAQLFKDHRELIAKFNTFMPHGFKIDLPPEDSKGNASDGRHESRTSSAADEASQNQGPDIDLDYSLSYLSQIKSMFATQPKIYNDFTYIIKEYKLKTMEIPEVIRRVSHLFRDYPELIAGFNSFLPPWCKINVSLTVKKEKEDIDPLASSSCTSTNNINNACAQHNGESSSSSKPRSGFVDCVAAASMPNQTERRAKRMNSSHSNTASSSAASSSAASSSAASSSAASSSAASTKRIRMEVIPSDMGTYRTPDDDPQRLHIVDETVEVKDEDGVYSSGTARPKSIVETINSLCNQLQTIVDQNLTAGQSQVAEEDMTGAELYSFVCSVCLKSFQKKQALQEHVKLHQMRR